MEAEKSDNASTVSGASHAQKLHESLDQYSKDQKLRNRPALILSALICLFCSSTFGIILAGITLAFPVDVVAACITRDLILFSSVFSYLYIGLHFRAARRDYFRLLPGPPQLHGNYMHASALLVARLAIIVWLSALIAASAMVAMSSPARGMEGAVPYLNLMICIGAIPAFVVISATIETNTVPFATACVSKPSLLTCRVSDFADDLAADMSVSRRASFARRMESEGTTPTGVTNTPGIQTIQTSVMATPVAKQAAEVKSTAKPTTPPTADSTKPPQPAVITPPPTYNPGGWKKEFNGPAPQATEAPAAAPAIISPQQAPAPAPVTPTVTTPTTEAPPTSGTSTSSSSSYSIDPSSYFTNDGRPSFPSNKRPRMPMRMGPLRPDSFIIYHDHPAYTPPAAPTRSYSGLPGGVARPPMSRNYSGSSYSSPGQRSKLSTVQYAEDVRMFPRQEPASSRNTGSPPAPSSRVNPPQSEPIQHSTSEPTGPTMTPALPMAKPPSPTYVPRPLPSIPTPTQPTTAPPAMPVQMPGSMPNPLWQLRKAQNAQRSAGALDIGSSNSGAAHVVSANAPRRVPAPYYEDVPDEGEPGR